MFATKANPGKVKRKGEIFRDQHFEYSGGEQSPEESNKRNAHARTTRNDVLAIHHQRPTHDRNRGKKLRNIGALRLLFSCFHTFRLPEGNTAVFGAIAKGGRTNIAAREDHARDG